MIGVCYYLLIGLELMDQNAWRVEVIVDRNYLFFKVFLTDRFEDEGYNWNKCMILVCFIDVVVILLFIRLSVVIAYILYTSLTRAEYSWTCNSKMFMTTRNIPNQALIHVLISKFWSSCQLTVGIKYELSILTMSCNCLFIQIYIAHIQKKGMDMKHCHPDIILACCIFIIFTNWSAKKFEWPCTRSVPTICKDQPRYYIFWKSIF